MTNFPKKIQKQAKNKPKITKKITKNQVNPSAFFFSRQFIDKFISKINNKQLPLDQNFENAIKQVESETSTLKTRYNYVKHHFRNTTKVIGGNSETHTTSEKDRDNLKYLISSPSLVQSTYHQRNRKHEDCGLVDLEKVTGQQQQNQSLHVAYTDLQTKVGSTEAGHSSLSAGFSGAAAASEPTQASADNSATHPQLETIILNSEIPKKIMLKPLPTKTTTNRPWVTAEQAQSNKAKFDALKKKSSIEQLQKDSLSNFSLGLKDSALSSSPEKTVGSRPSLIDLQKNSGNGNNFVPVPQPRQANNFQNQQQQLPNNYANNPFFSTNPQYPTQIIHPQTTNSISSNNSSIPPNPAPRGRVSIGSLSKPLAELENNLETNEFSSDMFKSLDEVFSSNQPKSMDVSREGWVKFE